MIIRLWLCGVAALGLQALAVRGAVYADDRAEDAAPPAARAGDHAAPTTQPTTEPTTEPHKQPSTQPAPRDDADFARLEAIDRQAARISTFDATFRQEKHAMLLSRPLVSTGRVRVKDGMVRWDTSRPHATVMTLSKQEVRLYYPAQKTVEVYTLDDRLASLFASPLPRLAVLRKHFVIQQLAGKTDAATTTQSTTQPTKQPPADAKQVGEKEHADAASTTADGKARDAASSKPIVLKLLPREAQLRKHVSLVVVTIDPARACATRIELADMDGEITVLSFGRIRINPPMEGDLSLTPPDGTRVVHPMSVGRDE